jgi:hypothetical protein
MGAGTETGLDYFGNKPKQTGTNRDSIRNSEFSETNRPLTVLIFRCRESRES